MVSTVLSRQASTPVLPRDQQTTERFFNTDAYVVQPFGTFGNVGRNTLIGPRY